MYKADPRYNEKAQSMFQIDLGSPEALPDALRGEKWAFVQLPLGALKDMLKKVRRGKGASSSGCSSSGSSAGCCSEGSRTPCVPFLHTGSAACQYCWPPCLTLSNEVLTAGMHLPFSPFLRDRLAAPLPSQVEGGEIFGSSFSLASAGLGDLPSDLLVPGVAVFSRRALPLAAWTNGLEIACVKADVARACLVLETGKRAGAVWALAAPPFTLVHWRKTHHTHSHSHRLLLPGSTVPHSCATAYYSLVHMPTNEPAFARDVSPGRSSAPKKRCS